MISLRKFLNSKIIGYLEIVFILALVAYYTLPFFSVILPFYLFLLTEIVYTLYIFLISTKKVRFQLFYYVFFIILLTLCYYFLTRTKTVDPSDKFYDVKRFAAKLNQLVNFFIPILIFYRLSLLPKLYRNCILGFSLFCILFVTFNSLIFFIPRLSSSYARDWTSFTDLEKKNIATYSYVYAVSCFIPSLYCFSRKQRDKLYKIIGFSICALMFLLLCCAQYTISIVIPLVFVIIYELRRFKLETIILLLIPLFVVLFFLPQIIYGLSTLLPYGVVRNRLLAVASYMFGNTAGTSELIDRLNLYKDSMLAFFESPFIGNSSLEFDGHATFLTILSDVGIVGAIPAFMLYFCSKSRIKRILNDSESYNMWKNSFIAMIIVGFLNPIHASFIIGFIVWFLSPSLKFAGNLEVNYCEKVYCVRI